MNMKSIIIFFYATLLTVFLPTLCFASSFNNKDNWYTFENDLFKIHYKKNDDYIVNDVIFYATQAHKKLSELFLFDPVKELKQKTHIVLISSTDEANGAATSLPQNTVYLYLNLPVEGSMLENYNSYLKALIFHEYTHIVNISAKKNYSKILYKIFGNIVSPNLLQPLWLTEGFAVWAESNIPNDNNSGRLNSTLTEMVFRTAFYNNKVPPIDRLPYTYPYWPLGNTPYLYGGAIINEISKKHGNLSIGELSYSNSGHLPFFINLASRSSTNSDFYYYYDQFLIQGQEKYDKIVARIKSNGITPHTTLTSNGNYKTAIGLSERGILFTTQSIENGSSLNLIDKNNEKIKTILKTSVFGRNISSFNDIIFFSKLYSDTKGNSFSKITLYNMKSKKSKVIHLKDNDQNLIRVRDPFISNDGKWIVCVGLQSFSTSLLKITLNDNTPFNLDFNEKNIQIEPLATFPRYYRAGTPKISPDQKNILFSLKEKAGTNILVLNLPNDTVEKISDNSFNNLTPNWINNTDIIYSSDKTSVFNIYKQNIKTGKLDQITNLLGGAFYPVYYNNKIFFVNYTAKGYEVASTNINQSFHSESTGTKKTFLIPKSSLSKETLNKSGKKSKYNSIKNMAPKSWLPYVFSNSDNKLQTGVFTFGSDPLLRNIYTLAPFYDSGRKKLLYDIFFINNAYTPQLTFFLSDNYYNYSINRTRKIFSFSILWPFFDGLTDFEAYLDGSTTSGLYLSYNLVKDPRNLRTSYLAMGHRRNTRSRYRKSISFEKGSFYDIEYRLFNKVVNSDFNEHLIRAMGEKYFSLTNHIVYKPSIYGSYFTGRKNFFFLGGSNDSIISASTGFKTSLRGFNRDSISSIFHTSLNHELFFPISYIYRGIGTFPYFLQNFSGFIFFDSTLNKAASRDETLYYSVGCGINKKFMLGYHLPIDLKFSMSHGFGKEGINAFYISISGDPYR